MPRLENWYIQTFSDGEFCLWGNTYNDHRAKLSGEFQDGHLIRTSIVKELDPDEKFAITMNTRYELGGKHE